MANKYKFNGKFCKLLTVEYAVFMYEQFEIIQAEFDVLGSSG